MKVKYVLILVLFLTILFALGFTADDNDLDMRIFTEEELAWLKDNPVIRVAPEDDYAPVEYYKGGEFIGLSRDYLNWISETYNIQFEFVYYDTWSEILEALKNNEVDLQTAIVRTPERAKYLNFTDPYVTIPNVVLVRKDTNIDLNIDTLFRNDVGIIKDYAVHEYIKLVYSPSDLTEYIDVRSALTDLSLGEIDALIVDVAQASYYIQDMAISNVVVNNDVKINFDYKLSFATPKDSEIIASILGKAIDSMPKIKQNELFRKWVSIGDYSWIDKNLVKVLLYIMGFAILLFIIAGSWSIMLKREVKAKTRDLDAELKYSKKVASELSLLTKELEERVKERSQSLQNANEHLEESLNALQKKENELLEINKLLERQIEVIEETQMQLIESEKLNALSRLVIGIAHEINTPLGSGITVISYAKSIINKIKGINDANAVQENKKEINAFLEELSSSNEKALLYLQATAKIVEDFRLVANYNYEDNEQEFLLDENIIHIIKMFKTQQHFRHYRFNLDLQANIKVNTSKRGILQIVSAIIENSYYHAYEGANEGVIDISLSQEGDEISLSIRDYGVGMSEDVLNKIFEPFYKSTLGSKRMGLGLYAAYNIISGILKGKITVTSKPNEGSTFHITFNIN